MATTKTIRILEKFDPPYQDRVIYMARATRSSTFGEDSYYELLGFGMFPKFTMIPNQNDLEEFKELCREKGEHVVFLDEIEQFEELSKKEKELSKRIEKLEDVAIPSRLYKTIGDFEERISELEKEIEVVNLRVERIVDAHPQMKLRGDR